MIHVNFRPRSTLVTARLTLRAPRPEDAQRIADLASDRGVSGMTTSIPYPLSVAQAGEFLARMAARDPKREAVFAIETAADGLIGVLGFHPKAGRAPEVGYWLGRPYWGLGYATEALKAALDWAQGDWRERCVIAGHFADNEASGGVLIKAGFLYTGVVETRYSLARDADVPTRMMVWLA
jgi:RimJ/RimL family protein N-acetyltransferase